MAFDKETLVAKLRARGSNRGVILCLNDIGSRRIVVSGKSVDVGPLRRYPREISESVQGLMLSEGDVTALAIRSLQVKRTLDWRGKTYQNGTGPLLDYEGFSYLIL